MKKDTLLAIMMMVVVGSVAVSPVLVETARGATANVSVKWYIPSDVAISVSYPTGLGAVEFRPAGENFSGQDAHQQVEDTTWAFNVTNSGNVEVALSGAFSTDLPTGVTFFNLSSAFGTEDQHFWVPANDTSSAEFMSALAVDAQQGFYCWSSGTEVVNASWPMERTFQVTTTPS